jgi:hypothetical protein
LAKVMYHIAAYILLDNTTHPVAKGSSVEVAIRNPDGTTTDAKIETPTTVKPKQAAAAAKKVGKRPNDADNATNKKYLKSG